jgi:hypothetical protein
MNPIEWFDFISLQVFITILYIVNEYPELFIYLIFATILFVTYTIRILIEYKDNEYKDNFNHADHTFTPPDEKEEDNKEE